ncbi:MAG: LysR family transcriptional regulator [Paracoccaceae bacterium]
MDQSKTLFNGMALFCTIVEHQSLTSAAKLLGHTASHVSKELARLEARLGARLLNRTTRKISLTEIGRIYYNNARRIVSDAAMIENQIQTLGDKPFGELKISIPAVFAQSCFMKWVPDFLHDYPDISLNLDVSDRKVDMISEGYDMIVRIGTLPDSEFIARELFKTGMSTIAAPKYLANHGTPEHPHDLASHTLIDFSLRDVAHTWSYPDKNAPPIVIAVNPRVRCNDAEMEKTLALAGVGITRLPDILCDGEIRQGLLVRILREYEPPAAAIHLVYPKRDHLPRKTRVMADFLIKKSNGLN